MSAANTDTRLICPAEARKAIDENRPPNWHAPLTTRWTHQGKHRLNEDQKTRRIRPEQVQALREHAEQVRAQQTPVVSQPVPVAPPVKASASPSKWAMLTSNMRRLVRRPARGSEVES